MHPILFHILKFPIHSYGLMLALSFLFGIWFAAWRARKSGLDPNVVADLGFWVLIAAIVGARAYYVVLHFEEFSGDLTSIFNPFHKGNLGIGGLVMYGGFIGAVVAAVAYFRLRKERFLPYADISSASLGFGIFLTRIGCFLNGCCYGAATTAACGVSFPTNSPAGQYMYDVHAHALIPSQLIESGGGLLIAIIILLVGTRKTFVGFRFYLTGLMYSVLRFCVDFTRFYTPHEKFGPLSHNQVICIAFFILFSGLILRNFLSKEEGTAAPGPADVA
jgi:phosphatidylglycerol---prolipoprotein diacylglyceryl transferase